MDQTALKRLLSLKDCSGKMSQIGLRLGVFEVAGQYRPGIKNSLADGGSRFTTHGGDSSTSHDKIPFFMLDTEDEEPEVCVSMLSEKLELPIAPTLK
jgi:hypothetical protein